MKIAILLHLQTYEKCSYHQQSQQVLIKAHSLEENKIFEISFSFFTKILKDIWKLIQIA